MTVAGRTHDATRMTEEQSKTGRSLFAARRVYLCLLAFLLVVYVPPLQAKTQGWGDNTLHSPLLLAWGYCAALDCALSLYIL